MARYDHLEQVPLGQVTIDYNPNVEVNILRVASVTNTNTKEKKVDLRIWTDMPKFTGYTQKGFRLDKKQYMEFRKVLRKVDRFFGVDIATTEPEEKDEGS